MSAVNEVFPVDISHGSRGGPGFHTNIIALPDSGLERRVARRSIAKRRWNAKYGVKSYTQLLTVRDFYVAMLGPATGFLYFDYLDCTSSASGKFRDTTIDNGTEPAFDDQVIGTADGSTTVFQLKKRYSYGSVVRAENIYKPIGSSVLIGVNGVEQTSGWSVNEDTGQVTFSVAPASGDVTWGGKHYWPARFDKSIDDLLDLEATDFASGGVPDIPIVQILDGAEIPEEFFYGGSKTFDPVTANVDVTIGLGRVHVFKNVNAGLVAYLQEKADLQPGGVIFYLVHGDSAGNNIEIRDKDTDTAVYTLTPGEVREATLSDDGAGNYTWWII